MRVSTEKQDLSRQEEALKHIKTKKVYKEKISAGVKDRPELNKLRIAVKAGDNVYFESISRLGRNVLEIKKLIEEFKEKGVMLHFVREGIVANGKNTDSMVNFLLNILCSVSELEKEVIGERVKQGIHKAQLYGTKSGKPVGRPPAKLPRDFPRVYELFKTGKIKGKDAMRIFEITRPTLYNWIKIYETDNPEKVIKRVRKNNTA
jgi:DNA invertase Pin-like site-specific DNA recombinase